MVKKYIIDCFRAYELALVMDRRERNILLTTHTKKHTHTLSQQKQGDTHGYTYNAHKYKCLPFLPIS